MASYVDFEAIKKQVSFEMVFARYSIDVVGRKGDELTIRCPFHDDTRPSLKANLAKGVFNCFGGCGAKGDVIEFVRRKEGMAAGERNRGRVEAARIMGGWCGIAGEAKGKHVPAMEPSTGARGEAESSPIIETPGDNPVLTFTLKVDPGHAYFAERGLQPDTVTRFGLGYCARGVMKGRIAIPIHNAQGELVAYAGRWPGESGWPEGEGKYKLPPNFHKSREVYNLHQVPGGEQCVIVVEGFWSVFWLWQECGIQNVVALMGCTISARQGDMLSRFPAVKILFDGDQAGREAAGKVTADLARHVWVKIVACPDGREPDRMSAAQLRTLLA